MKNLQYYITVIPAALIAITFHEMSHAFAAYLLGDRTAQYNGRLSFNPISHIDPLGLMCMIFFGFGWAKPVPIDPRYFKHPKAGMAATAVAGPLANFFLGFVSVFIYVIIAVASPGRILSALASFMYILGAINIGLGLFNLIPIPPLDGSKIMFMFLPNRIVEWFYRYDGYIRLALLLGLYFGMLDGFIGSGQTAFMNFALKVSVSICSALGII